MSNKEDKISSLLRKIWFIDNKPMKIIFAISMLVLAFIYILFVSDWYISIVHNTGISFKIKLWINIALGFIPVFSIGIIGKIVFHNFVKIKCERCGEINRGDIEYCTKCDYQIQDFKDNKLF